jgi:hypothetical protein
VEVVVAEPLVEGAGQVVLVVEGDRTLVGGKVKV